jgi:hypothetical protein
MRITPATHIQKLVYATLHVADENSNAIAIYSSLYFVVDTQDPSYKRRKSKYTSATSTDNQDDPDNEAHQQKNKKEKDVYKPRNRLIQNSDDDVDEVTVMFNYLNLMTIVAAVCAYALHTSPASKKVYIYVCIVASCIDTLHMYLQYLLCTKLHRHMFQCSKLRLNSLYNPHTCSCKHCIGN